MRAVFSETALRSLEMIGRSAAALVPLALAAACSSPMQFRWPDQPIWPGQTRVFASRGGELALRVECRGPGDITVVDASSVSHVVGPETAFETTLDGDSEVNLVNPVGGEPTAVSVQVEMYEAVQLRFEEISHGGGVASRTDFDGSVSLQPGEALTLEIEGEEVVTSLSDAKGAPLQIEPLDPIEADRRLDSAGKHVFRGPVRLRVSVQAMPASTMPIAIRNATAWSLVRHELAERR